MCKTYSNKQGGLKISEITIDIRSKREFNLMNLEEKFSRYCNNGHIKVAVMQSKCECKGCVILKDGSLELIEGIVYVCVMENHKKQKFFEDFCKALKNQFKDHRIMFVDHFLAL